MLKDLAQQANRIAGTSPGSERLRSPGELVARMRSQFGALGITRLAEITRLDKVGWPVWAAIRPNAPTLSVCQGKGPTSEAAQASAIMEAVEITTAERIQASLSATCDDLRAAGMTFDLLHGLVRRGHKCPAPHQAIGWIKGYDLIADRDVWVPVQAIQLDATDPHRDYWQSSDGLGSGSLMIEAVLHGLCEQIERDAGELWHLRTDEDVANACLDPRDLGSAQIAALADTVEHAGLHLRLFEITSDIGVPAYFSTVSPMPSGREEHWTHFDLASGMGCRLDPARAALAAIGEALQSRLTTISGARDDFQPQLYRQRIASDILIYPRCRPDRRQSPDRAEVSILEAIETLVGRLAAVGVSRVIVVPLREDCDAAVAKVLVPELERPPGARAVMHGARARRALEERSR